MNYKKVYEDLIQKRTVLQCLSESSIGCENHHIVPVSEGGSNDKDNIVRLTIKEHIFAHQLLARIYNDSKMWGAINLMMTVNGEHKCLRLASIARQRHNDLICGNRNTFYGRHHTEDTRHTLSEKTIEYISQHGNAFSGRKHSEESKRRMSETHKGRTTWLGKHHSDVTKKKISESHKGKLSGFKGRHHSVETKRKISEKQIYANPKSKGVVQMDFDMNIVNEFISTRAAERATGTNRHGISDCCNGKIKKANGFIWRFK
jgi:inorganic triphosphatase YgiF